MAIKKQKLDEEQILARLIELFEKVFEGELSTEGLGLSSRLIEDIGMNSIGLLYMAIAVEEEFGVKFTNEDFELLRCVGDVVERIEAKG